MGLMDGLAEGRRKKVVDFVSTQTGESGDPVAVLPMSERKQWSGMKYFGFALYPDRLVAVAFPQMTEQPKEIAAQWPPADVAVAKWKRGMITSKLTLATPEGEFFVEVPRIHAGDAEGLVEALGGTPK